MQSWVNAGVCFHICLKEEERYQRKEFAKQAVNSPESVGPKKGPPSKAEQNGQLMQAFADYGNYMICLFVVFIVFIKLVHRRFSEGSDEAVGM